jgi:hypothetical protein
MTSDYQRIIYPERAEYLEEESVFSGYRIFLDHWSDITSYIQECYEVLRTRRFSKSLIIYGKQGCGKSVLANKLSGDFEITKRKPKDFSIAYDSDNIWHRITAGSTDASKSENIRSAINNTVVLLAENKQTWVSEAVEKVSGNKDRACLVIADNCEKDYFLKGLLNVSDEVYLQTGRSVAAIRSAAHRFVELSRTTLRGCFFIFFTNDEDFAIAFDQHVNEQHRGLMDIKDLKMPPDNQKEAIVRINVNRLNSLSYWVCIDRAGPTEKSAVWKTLSSAETFPATFHAVDNAIRSSALNRQGRPARKCILNAYVITNANDVSGTIDADLNCGDYEDIFSGRNFVIRIYKSNWGSLFGDARENELLSSEWHLKIIISSDRLVSAILGGYNLAKEVIQTTTVYHSAGTRDTTKQQYQTDLQRLDAALNVNFEEPNNAAFWAKGSVRNNDYESRLKMFFPSYNTSGSGFLSARPDLIFSDYVPCTVLHADNDSPDAINTAIRRQANTVEFTAIKDFTPQKLISYLSANKIQNYVNTVQEQ